MSHVITESWVASVAARAFVDGMGGRKTWLRESVDPAKALTAEAEVPTVTDDIEAARFACQKAGKELALQAIYEGVRVFAPMPPPPAGQWAAMVQSSHDGMALRVTRQDDGRYVFKMVGKAPEPK